MTEATVHTPAILIEGAKKRYSGRGTLLDAVTDVSIRVARGSVHGLLGPNGAGKTTTLKMLLGLVRPDAGRFEILGAAAGPEARARLGFLPEQPYFPALLTAEELMALHGRLSGVDKETRARRTIELLDRVGLRGREKSRISTFSRGMLQRLGIAQALIAKPDVLVLDEPASGLDPVGQRDVRDLMLQLRDQGVSILLSSHQLSEVEAVCDEVSILVAGRVAAEGDISSLLQTAGQTSVRARGHGDEELPDAVAPLVDELAVAGGEWVFSVAEDSVRRVVDALDDEGWTIEAITPKRESLEDYFAKLVASTGEGVSS